MSNYDPDYFLITGFYAYIAALFAFFICLILFIPECFMFIVKNSGEYYFLIIPLLMGIICFICVESAFKSYNYMKNEEIIQ